VSKTYVLDANALIALLGNEDGADNVAAIYAEADSGEAEIIMNAVNLLEVYYDFYRAYDKKTADEMIAHVEKSIINIVTEIDKPLVAEAGRLKAIYKMSLADTFAVAQVIVSNGVLVTSDHHELEPIETSEGLNFMWFR